MNSDLSHPPPPHHRGSWKLALAALAMFGFGFALAPLYSVVCQLTGFRGYTDRIGVEQALTRKVALDRVITVQFVGNTVASLPWEFGPDQPSVAVHPGQLVTATFHARNVGNVGIVGQAVPSVTPGEAAPYFHKVACFCFSRQPLGAGEEKEMPVEFVVDPDLPPDIGTLTLSYTFFAVPGVQADAAAARRPAT